VHQNEALKKTSSLKKENLTKQLKKTDNEEDNEKRTTTCT